MASVAFSPDGKLLAAGGADGRVRLWEAEHGWPVSSFHPNDRGVFSPPLGFSSTNIKGLAFSPDGKHLATAFGPTLRFWAVDRIPGPPLVGPPKP